MRLRPMLAVLAGLAAFAGAAPHSAHAEVKAAGTDATGRLPAEPYAERVQVSPVWEKGRVVGARVTVTLPDGAENVRVGVRPAAGKGAASRAFHGNAHGKPGRAPSPKDRAGLLVHELKEAPGKDGFRKRTVELRYGRGHGLRGGDKVEVVTRAVKPEGKRVDRASHAAARAPSWIVTLPGKAPAQATLCGASGARKSQK